MACSRSPAYSKDVSALAYRGAWFQFTEYFRFPFGKLVGSEPFGVRNAKDGIVL